MTAIRLAVVAITAGVGLTVGGAGPAAACSCAVASTRAYVGSADVVVTGTLSDVQNAARQPIMSSADPITYTVEIHRTFKGEPRSRIEFTSARSGASCGLEGMRVGRDYTLFLDSRGGGLTASLCGGTASASENLEKRIISSTGPPAASADSASPPTSQPPERPDGDSPQLSAVPLWISATVGGGVVVLAAVGTWLWRRRLRRARSPA